MLNDYCIIVDPYISANSICDALLAKNIKLIAVLTDLQMSEHENEKRFPKQKFSFCFDYNDDLFEKLSKFHIIGVVAGHEISVSITDQLAKLYCPLFANNNETSAWRNNKYEMQEAIKAAGLASIKQIKTQNNFLTEQQIKMLSEWKWPLIIKPTNSFCSFDVTRNNDKESLITNVRNLMDTIPKFGNSINEIVIQECLQGEEYFVDTVSLNGHHKIVSVFHYQKIQHKNNPIYRYAEIISANTQEAITCIDYVKSVLTAIQLNNGLAHTEIFLTKDGPYLIEVNPRISGAHGLPNKLSAIANDRHQATLLAESIASPSQFIDHYKTPPIMKSYGMVAMVHGWHKGHIKHFAEEKLLSLPSYKETVLLKTVGDHLDEPESLLDAAGLVLLSHQNKDVVLNDYETISKLELSGSLFLI